MRGNIHHDRRLHQLMLQEEEKAWDATHPADTLLDEGGPACSCASSATAFTSHSTHRPISQTGYRMLEEADMDELLAEADSASSLPGPEASDVVIDEYRYASRCCMRLPPFPCLWCVCVRVWVWVCSWQCCPDPHEEVGAWPSTL